MTEWLGSPTSTSDTRLAWAAGITLRELQATSADLERAFFAMTGNNKSGN